MKILIVDDEPAARYGMAKALKSDGRLLLEAGDGAEALTQVRQQCPDLVFLDLNMPGRDGLFVLKELQRDASVAIPEIIVVTANDGVDVAVECIRCGATDFITKPYDIEHIRSIATRTEARVKLQNRVTELETNDRPARFGALLGGSGVMQQLFRSVDKAAATSLPVVIRGESGTGKELIARELHQRGDRADRPFVAVNTAAIAESLVESELFGHIKGAFTGADRNRTGVFRQADGGTLFLDEIGDMPATVQTRLLRVLQEGIVQPIGTEECIKVDVRIVSATHQDLDQAVTDRAFRQDLFFRLKGIELFIPPLRNRHEDILLLAKEFLAANAGSADVVLSHETVAAMLQHTWPGNVRELQQMVSAAAALCEGDVIHPADVGLAPTRSKADDTAFERYLDLPLTEARNQLVETFERLMIERSLQMESGNVSAAARRLGIHRQSLQQKMKQMGTRPS
ncbi:MAG: sigma-54-dependent Fis family transcriptional regulator [Fuerstiella sp.]|nr:sigma-54-dependent Fis family transcriptional regulator [Fuerstiella sp.]